MQTFIENSDNAFSAQLDNFCTKIDPYQMVLGLDTTKIESLKMMRDMVLFVFDNTDKAHQYSLSSTAYKNHLRYGLDGIEIGPLPVLAVSSIKTPALAVTQSAQSLFSEMIQDCTRSKSFTIAIATDLGILKPSVTFDPQAGQPDLFVTTAKGGHPLLHAKMGKYEAYEVWKDSGDGGGDKLTGTSLHPDFLDTSALPAKGASAIWTYKIIYIYKGEHAGSWSTEVAISVYGNI